MSGETATFVTAVGPRAPRIVPSVDAIETEFTLVEELVGLLARREVDLGHAPATLAPRHRGTHARASRAMAFTWPEFKANQPLDGGRSWTAMFDSYDQYKENVYYLVRLFQGAIGIDEFMVEVGTEWTGDDWTVPTFLPELTRRIAEVAATGKTNAAYSR